MHGDRGRRYSWRLLASWLLPSVIVEFISQNEAYVCLGLSELSHSDQILQQCGTKAAEPNINHC